MIKLAGRMSYFGGPRDHGVGPGEGLALIRTVSDKPEVFLKDQPPGTTGLARRLDPSKFYIATRWNYSQTPVAWLRSITAKVTNPRNNVSVECSPVDWGPNEKTGRIADLSPGAVHLLSLDTDDVCEVHIPTPDDMTAEVKTNPFVHGPPPVPPGPIMSPPVAPPELPVRAEVAPVWPLQRDCRAFYGDPQQRGWLQANTVDVACPWQLWFGKVPIKHILIHRECFASLTRVLDAIWEGANHSEDKIKALHYDQFSGSYNLRVMRGGAVLSMHAYACAIDFYDAGNPFHSETHAFHEDSLIVKAFEAEGWVWGGAWAPGSIDAMHFQAARIHP